MGNPLKKTMVFLGLAEEELDEQGNPVEPVRAESEPAPAPAAAKPAQRAPVTPLRKVAPVRQVMPQAMNEILTVHPTEYLNLSRMNEAEAKRLIDFASGLTMGLSGRIERVTSKVFLLSPEHIATSNGESPKQGESGSFFVSATA